MCTGYVKLISGSACDLKMAARYVRHLTEPAFGNCFAIFSRQSLLHAHALHAVVPETMPRAVSLRKSGSVCVLCAAALCECDRGGRGR